MILVIANAKERLLVAALRRTQRTGQDALRLPFLACQDLVMSMQACPARASSYQAGQSCPSPTFQVKLASSLCSAGTDGLRLLWLRFALQVLRVVQGGFMKILHKARGH